MDKRKIIRLIEEADEIVSALYQQGANKDYKCKALREKLNAITAEITKLPEKNADRVRQMTEAELVDVLRCNCCDFYNKQECMTVDCKIGHMIWLDRRCDDGKETVLRCERDV